MKKLILAAALVTLIGAPAFAQSFDPSVGTGNSLPFAYTPTHGNNGFGAYAQAAPQVSGRAYSCTAKYFGSDPDPAKRDGLVYGASSCVAPQ